MVQLMAVADALPPAAFKLLGKDPAPISSLTWIVNLLTPAPATTDGWWLLSRRRPTTRSTAARASRWRCGTPTGQCVAQGMQSVAIFA